MLGRYFKNRFGQSIQIVGIVADGKYFSLTEIRKRRRSSRSRSKQVLKRPSSSGCGQIRPTRPRTMAGTVRKLIRDLDPRHSIVASSAWNNQRGLRFFVAQVATVALGLFGAFGLLLSITGTLRPRLVNS
jgi:hypothetical protein